MKWNKGTLLAVLAILIISISYSSIKHRQLSNKVKEEQLRVCSEQEEYDCEVIVQFHDECFSSSYRAQYKMKKFHPNEYNSCINRKIGELRNQNEN